MSSHSTSACSSHGSDMLRQELEDTFLRNEISAQRFHSILQKSKAAGIHGISKYTRKTVNKHLKRNMMRAVLKTRKAWCDIFWHPISIYDPATGKTEKVNHPFVLPHDWLIALSKGGQSTALQAAKPHLDEQHHLFAKQHIAAVCQELQTNPDDYVALGLHGDGVPFGTRNDSLEILSLNLPCYAPGGIQSRLRIPFTAVQKRNCSQSTISEILDVLSWSLKWLSIGVYPMMGPMSNSLPRKCQAMAGKPMPKALLTEIRADWAWLKSAYGFPQHNELAGICWLCRATPQNFTQITSDAEWRSQRLSPQEFHQLQLQKGVPASSLFSCPGVSAGLVRLDWLHICDSGVTADIFGNMLLVLSKYTIGSNIKSRVENLWNEMKTWYVSSKVTEQLDHLRLEHFQSSKQSPKLKAKAAAIRQLVGFFPPACDKLLPPSPENDRIKKLAGFLVRLYQCLQDFDPAQISVLGKAVLILYKELRDLALEKDANSLLWKMKPKVHLFAELTGYMVYVSGNPKYSWTYKDEDHGGYVKRLVSRRGGKNSSKSTCLALIQRFFSLNEMPVL